MLFKIHKKGNSRLFHLSNLKYFSDSKLSSRIFNQLPSLKYMPDSKRSQSAIEFLILIGVIAFFFTIFFAALNENIGDKTRERKTIAIENIAVSVQDEINLASKSSDGYSRQFNVPNDFNGEDYSINLTDGMVYVKSSDNKYAIALPIPNITGNVGKGNNLIKKQGGVIYLNSST